MNLKTDLGGLVRGAADTIDPELDRGACAFALREVAANIEKLKLQPELLPEFLEMYCLPSVKSFQQAERAIES